MLEILALSYFGKQIRKTAEEKGIKSGKWLAATIISWFAIEILFFVIAFAFFDVDRDGILLVMIPAILVSATVAYIILEKMKQQESVKVKL